MFNTNAWLSAGLTSNCFKNSYIQGCLDICGNIVLRNGGFSLTNGDVSMNGNIWVGKNSKIIGNVSMNGNLWVGLDASLNRNVSIRGNTIITNSIYQIDGRQNMNIASSTVGTFPNYSTTATGPNLMNIGGSNFSLTGSGMRNSIAIGYTHYQASNPTGHSNIAIGLNNFNSSFVSGNDNVVIGAYNMYNCPSGSANVFIGRAVCSNTAFASNSVCIGPAAGTWYAGTTQYTGSNMTALGAFNGQPGPYAYFSYFPTPGYRTGYYSNVTVIGTNATGSGSNQTILGTASETVDISGSLNVTGDIGYLYSCPFYSKSKIVGFSCNRTTSNVTISGDTRIPIGSSGYNSTHFNTGEMASTGIFTAPVSGYYMFYFNITVSAFNASATTTISFVIRQNATAYNNGTVLSTGTWVSGTNISYTGIISATTVAKLNSGDTVSVYTGPTVTGGTYSLTYSTSTSASSNCYGVLLFAS
jgi:hypothetical protein